MQLYRQLVGCTVRNGLTCGKPGHFSHTHQADKPSLTTVRSKKAAISRQLVRLKPQQTKPTLRAHTALKKKLPNKHCLGANESYNNLLACG